MYFCALVGLVHQWKPWSCINHCSWQSKQQSSSRCSLCSNASLMVKYVMCNISLKTLFWRYNRLPKYNYLFYQSTNRKANACSLERGWKIQNPLLSLWENSKRISTCMGKPPSMLYSFKYSIQVMSFQHRAIFINPIHWAGGGGHNGYCAVFYRHVYSSHFQPQNKMPQRF